MTEKQWKGAIFDLDGTLLDSMGVWDQVDIDLKKEIFPMPDDYKQKIAAMGFRRQRATRSNALAFPRHRRCCYRNGGRWRGRPTPFM